VQKCCRNIELSYSDAEPSKRGKTEEIDIPQFTKFNSLKFWKKKTVMDKNRIF